MKCILCGNDSSKQFEGKILGKHEIDYFQCSECKLLFTEQPYWLNEAYSDPITCVDTGIMKRNIENAMFVNMLIHFCFDGRNVFLDWGGGYGVFTRMMRDIGYKWIWQDNYSPNLFARNFEYSNEKKIELITAFELLEHFAEPSNEFDKLFSISDNIVCSTLIYDSNNVPDFNSWWYYVKSTGQHIAFYSEETMEYIASRYNVNYYKISTSIHLFSKTKINPFILFVLKKRSSLLQWILYSLRKKESLTIEDMEYAIRTINKDNNPNLKMKG